MTVPTTAPRRDLRWLGRALSDGVLVAAAVFALWELKDTWVPLLYWTRDQTAAAVASDRWSKLALGWHTVAASFAVTFLAASILELANAFLPDRFSLLRGARPSSHLGRFVLGFLSLAAWAALACIAIELVIAIYRVGRLGVPVALAPNRIEAGFFTLFGLLLVGKVWLSIHPAAVVTLRQMLNWSSLSSWATKQKWLNYAFLGLIVMVYAAWYLQSSDSKFIRDLNDALTFKFAGFEIKASQILTLEALGFLIGILATALYALSVPIMFGSRTLNTREALRRTVRQCGKDLLGSHLTGTLEFYRDVLKNKLEWRTHNWDEVSTQLEKIKADQLPDERLREASLAVALFPADDDLLRDLGERLFSFVRPWRRYLISTLLLTAEILTALPVLIRLSVLFLPKLAEDPHSWLF